MPRIDPKVIYFQNEDLKWQWKLKAANGMSLIVNDIAYGSLNFARNNVKQVAKSFKVEFKEEIKNYVEHTNL